MSMDANYDFEFPMRGKTKALVADEVITSQEDQTNNLLLEFLEKLNLARASLAINKKDTADIILIELINTIKFLTK